MKTKRRIRLSAIMVMSAATFGGAHAAVVNSTSVFATGSAVGATGPDSLTDLNGSIWAEYGGGTNSQTGAGFSTIVQYSSSGSIQNTYSIAGSVDGLKANPVTAQIWALQNQDGNSHISLITPGSASVAGPFNYASPPYVYGASSARGYDDVAFLNGNAYLSFTNPAGASDPVVQQLLNGNNLSTPLNVSNVLTAGQTGIATPDIDSLKTTPSGGLVVSAETQARYSLITNPGTASQSVSNVQVVDATGKPISGIDDVLFPQATSGTLYVSSTGTNSILALNLSGLNQANPIVSLSGLGELATVDPATGIFTPLYASSQLSSPHGLDFLAASTTAVPEPASLLVLGSCLGALCAFRRRLI